MADLKARHFRRLLQPGAGEVNPVEAKGVQRIGQRLVRVELRHAVVAFHQARGRRLVHAVALAGNFQGLARHVHGRMIPPAQPRIVAHLESHPVVGHVVNRGQAAVAQAEDERLGKPEQAEDVDDVGREAFHDAAQGLMVLRLELLQLVEAGDEFMIVNAVEDEAPLDFTALLGHLHAM